MAAIYYKLFDRSSCGSAEQGKQLQEVGDSHEAVAVQIELSVILI